MFAETKEWRRLESGGVTPTPRAQSSMVMHANRLIIFGGYDGQNRLNDLHVLDLSMYKWHQPRSAEQGAPHARCGHTSVIVNNQMIVFGGERDASWPLRVSSCRSLWLLLMRTITERSLRRIHVLCSF